MISDLTGSKLVLRDHQAENTLIRVGNNVIGGNTITFMAGPCSVESEEQLNSIACQIGEAVGILRGGCFKPRSSPYSFQGLGEEGLAILRRVAIKRGKKTITEVMEPGQIELVSRFADILQVGARNMQNFPLLRALGEIRKPVLLKRGISATIDEWLAAAEYILAGGNSEVILCERGIRTFGSHTRFTLDVASIPVIKQLSHLPVVVDPSHAAGDRDLVKELALAAVAAGADGLIVEVHDRPEQALSDRDQALTVEQFRELEIGVRRVACAIGRRTRINGFGTLDSLEIRDTSLT